MSISCRKPFTILLPQLTSRPNHEELLAIYGQTCSSSGLTELKKAIIPLIQHLVDVIGVGEGHGAVVVRCGRHGSCVGTKTKGIKWFPAYFTEEDAGRVVDVSGGMSSYPYHDKY
jgi:hypothetical protein